MRGRNAYQLSVEKPERKTLGRSRRRRGVEEANLRTDLKKIECEGIDWINLALVRVQYRAVMDTVINLQVSLKARDFLTW
jgi:hypothetical protein